MGSGRDRYGEGIVGLFAYCVECWCATGDGRFTTSCKGIAYILLLTSLLFINVYMFYVAVAAYSSDQLAFIRSQAGSDFNFSSSAVCESLLPSSLYLTTNKNEMDAMLSAGCVYHSFWPLSEEEQASRAAEAQRARRASRTYIALSLVVATRADVTCCGLVYV